MVKIGVFDSGIGGQAVAEKLQAMFPDAEIVSIDDRRNVPYGSKSADEIISLTKSAIQPLIEAKCDAIVIACNTATTVAITSVREAYPDVHFVGIEPMVKPAAAITKTKKIAVLATPGTLASNRYRLLKENFAADVTVIEPDCSTWATLIETNEIEKIPLDDTVNTLLDQDVDVVVLGCTHYHWLKDRIEELVGPDVEVLEPSDAIGARLDSLLSQETDINFSETD
jgi:glutamate racemase